MILPLPDTGKTRYSEKFIEDLEDSYNVTLKLSREEKPKFHSQSSGPTTSDDGRTDSSSLESSSLNIVFDDQNLPSTSAKPWKQPSMLDGRIVLRMPSEQYLDVPRVSRLSVSLLDTLNGCSLDNFLAFMHDMAADHLVTFWIEAENFHVSSDHESVVGMNSVLNSGTDPQGNEAVSIFTKYFSPDSPYYINPTNRVREDVINAICLKDGSLDKKCFRAAKRFVYDLMEKRYFPLYERSKHYARYALAILRDSCVTLSDILYNEQALFYFTEFIERCGCLALLEFWLTILNFEHEALNDPALEKEQMQSDAMIIYRK
ncbi:unnamed protein product [Soboliphyme baturini]|uniref:RGS domain-containing protein n=1 Tax=Soboliphyme baturini TaxID=241478 RepID=A0A183IST4_9BILA|nr:unnamed protein product [Soboliphyme baturini]